MSETTGTVDFRVGEQTHQTWYRIFGDLHSGIRPVVALHGGPGIPHQYILPFRDLHDRFNIPVILYDQIGIGKSSHPKDIDPKAFYTVDRFIDELENIVDKLGIREFDLIGHSWGGMLAAHYVSHRHPARVRRLVIVSSPASMELWEKGTRKLLETLPEEVKEKIKKHERDGTTSDPEYEEGVNVFYAKYVCQINPWPKDLLEAFNGLKEDPTVYSTMIGPSEFTIVGSLKDWNIVNKLHTIKNETLVTNGADDEAQDISVAPFFREIPKVRWVTLAKSSHMAFYEERERFFDILGEFLSR